MVKKKKKHLLDVQTEQQMQQKQFTSSQMEDYGWFLLSLDSSSVFSSH